MFKKLFKDILDICKPGTDEPSCLWGGESRKSGQESISPPTGNQSNSLPSKKRED